MIESHIIDEKIVKPFTYVWLAALYPLLAAMPTPPSNGNLGPEVAPERRPPPEPIAKLEKVRGRHPPDGERCVISLFAGAA